MAILGVNNVSFDRRGYSDFIADAKKMTSKPICDIAMIVWYGNRVSTLSPSEYSSFKKGYLNSCIIHAQSNNSSNAQSGKLSDEFSLVTLKWLEAFLKKISDTHEMKKEDIETLEKVKKVFQHIIFSLNVGINHERARKARREESIEDKYCEISDSAKNNYDNAIKEIDEIIYRLKIANYTYSDFIKDLKVLSELNEDFWSWPALEGFNRDRQFWQIKIQNIFYLLLLDTPTMLESSDRKKIDKEELKELKMANKYIIKQGSLMNNSIALLGESEKGRFLYPYFCKNLEELISYLGNPPKDSKGIDFAIQAIMYERDIVYFRVQEEGYFIKDYFQCLEIIKNKIKKIDAICIPKVSNKEVIEKSSLICKSLSSIIITTKEDLFDYLLS